MKKIIFLLPPSEGKNTENSFGNEQLSFELQKPLEILSGVTEKDLKCSGNRFQEAQELHKNLAIQKSELAIKRYSGVMFGAIDYENLSETGKGFFNENVLIFSGLYGIVKPLDTIKNYKLPIEAKGLYQYWWDVIPEEIAKLQADVIVNLLPLSYQKLIGLGTNCNKHKKKLNYILKNSQAEIVTINFLKPDGKKISHGVKKIKGNWLQNICEQNITSYEQFGGEIVKNSENNKLIDINIQISK